MGKLGISPKEEMRNSPNGEMKRFADEKMRNYPNAHLGHLSIGLKQLNTL